MCVRVCACGGVDQVYAKDNKRAAHVNTEIREAWSTCTRQGGLKKANTAYLAKHEHRPQLLSPDNA